MAIMFRVRVSARLLLLLRCLLTVVCIPWMSRRSLDTAIRPWMYYCRSASAFNEPIGDWDTSSVTTMAIMFTVRVSARLLLLLRCLLTVVCIPWMSRRSLDTAIRPWMYYCRDAAAFNQPIGTWDTSSVTTMQSMFYVRVSAHLLLLLRCLLTIVCIPWMSRRSLDTAIRPWMYYCRVPLPSTSPSVPGTRAR